MWQILKDWQRGRSRRPAQRSAGPVLEALEDRLLLSPAVAAGTAPKPKAPSSTDRSSSIAATRGAQPHAAGNDDRPPPPPAPAPPPPMGGDRGLGTNGNARGVGGGGGGGMAAADARQGLPPPPRPGLVSRDPGSQVSAFAHPPEPVNNAVLSASRSAMAMHMLFADLDDSLPMVEVTGDLSFVEDDSRLTDRAFAALITNTRPRLDVVPQQGSAVASVATLMPSDRPDTTEPAAASEYAPLLITPLFLPVSVTNPAPAGPAGPSGGAPDRAPTLPHHESQVVDDDGDVDVD